ncbi:MAG TPA: cyclic nucleotide-binding domain-containing protein [Candidatus Sulfopaludibacter sp.]|nr:cyclic nucleotide-binding domain-containing protein [Candidatus Sulfopaludibacter sp.]
MVRFGPQLASSRAINAFCKKKQKEQGAITRIMGHITLTQRLNAHRFTSGLPEAQIATLAAIASEVTFAEDELILVDGQRSKAFFLLTSGSVAVELRTPQYVVCVQALGPGQVFGWSALLENQDTLFQVRARERTMALRIESGPLQAACNADPSLCSELLHRILQVVAGRVKATEIRFAEMCGVRV